MNRKLTALRTLMKHHRIHAYLIPSSDPHQSEYVPECWRRRAFLTGFTGSTGDALVTLKTAGLWTDSRYYLQAERELRGSGFTLFKWGSADVPSWQDWAARNLRRGEILGFDPQLITHKEYTNLEKALGEGGIRLKPVTVNLVDKIWKEKPAPPSEPITILAEKYSGESVRSKLDRLRRKIAAEGAAAHILSQFDAVAWLFNIRGSDVQYNPVAIAYAVITAKDALLFIAREKVGEKVKAALKKKVRFRDYNEFPGELRRLASAKRRIWLDEASVSRWIVNSLQGAKLIFKPSPVALHKAVKNATEIRGAKQAHRRDGAAMVKFLYWLEKSVPKGGVTELSAAQRLEAFRSRQSRFRGPSFSTISAYRSHGAIVHYSVSPETDIPLKRAGIYLVDSGGQYLDATTDITRTVALGRPTAEQRDRFTRVLKGMIALSAISFPRGTTGPQLDVLARRALWEKGLNYGHGTGHGIGSYLNVHEGPQGISPARGFGVGLEPGMILSNEPAYYKEGEYGIRIENLILVIKDTIRTTAESPFYSFETLTLCPIDLRLVKRELLTAEEIRWLNSYHRRVRKELTPRLDRAEAAWLKNVTRPI
ncbi:MAG TPA: aminopeptidase P family protein [Candidatus Desulfaltia sp.]|nr:aminopeptidase P family protein [Candidatus Desulfaltia sp.]